VRTVAAALLVAASCVCAGARAEEAGPRREPIGYGAEFVRRDPCRCGGVGLKGIFAHPPWRGAKGRVIGAFELDLAASREPVLVFRMGILDGHGSDKGVIFRVSAGGRELWREFHREGAWSDPVKVDLRPCAGRKVSLELAVDSLGEHYACWGEPRIVDGAKVLFDLAEMAAAARRYVELMDEIPEKDLPASLLGQRRDELRQAVEVRPSARQLAWQELEFIAFAHFGVNTFTDKEWGDGTEDPAIFNPTALDARQWVRVCREAGMRLLILTAKHHDGFCLWPSRYTDHSVKRSPWRGGRGDVVREVSEACREGGLKFGIYLSPWDRHEPSYGDSPRYNEYFRNQLTELLTGYGEVAEVWFDGACGEGPNGKRQEYDWQSYYEVVRRHQPGAVIAISGPDVRWVGNEDGVARETEWSVQNASPAFHGRSGLVWWPAECDVSIRPGWFYHAQEDSKVKSLEHLLDIYYKSVGRNAVLLLNLPPDRRGLIHEADAARLRELRRALDETFRTNLASGARAASPDGDGASRAVDGDPATYFAAREDTRSATIEIELARPATFNRSMLREYIPLGQRIEEYSLEAHDGRAWRAFAKGTTIGYKKLDRFAPVTASRVRLVISKARAAPLVGEIGLYMAPGGA